MYLSKIVLGTVQFGLKYGVNNTLGKVNQEEVFKILDYAYDKGIRSLDTADSYGNAHHIIGKYHRQRKYKFQIYTKIKELIDQDKINKFLEELDIDEISALSIHSINQNDYQSFQKNMTKFTQLSGVKRIGISLYTNDEIDFWKGTSEIDVFQIPFNLLDNESLRGSALKELQENNKEVHVRSAFLQGLFFKDLSSLDGPLLKMKDDLEDLHKNLKVHNLQVPKACLGYCLSKQYIDKVLIGVDSLEQLKTNISDIESLDKNIDFSFIDKIKVKNKELLNPVSWS